MYFDENGALFIHKTRATPTLLEKHELQHVRLERNLGFDPETATESAAELEAFTTKYPQNYFAVGQLATIYRLTQQFDLADQTLTRIPSEHRNFATYTEMGRLDAARGLCKSAEENFLIALGFRNEKNYSRTILDLGVLYAGCFEDKAKAKHYFQRYNSFLITTSEREKLHALAKEFGIDFID